MVSIPAINPKNVVNFKHVQNLTQMILLIPGLGLVKKLVPSIKYLVHKIKESNSFVQF